MVTGRGQTHDLEHLSQWQSTAGTFGGCHQSLLGLSIGNAFVVETRIRCSRSGQSASSNCLQTPGLLFECRKLSLKFDEFQSVDVRCDDFGTRRRDPTASGRFGNFVLACQISSSGRPNDIFEPMVVLLLFSSCSDHHLMIMVFAAKLQARARELALKVPNVLTNSTAKRRSEPILSAKLVDSRTTGNEHDSCMPATQSYRAREFRYRVAFGKDRIPPTGKAL